MIGPNLTRVLTRKDLAKEGIDKAMAKKLVKEGRLEEGYGRIPETGQILIGYKKTDKFYNL